MKEQLRADDKAALDLSKMRRELAQANLRTAAAQADATELAHSNLILRFGIQYGLKDGDEIGDDGTITRKPPAPLMVPTAPGEPKTITRETNQQEGE